MQSKTLKSLLSDSVVYGLSGAISKFLGFLLIPIYTKVLTPADYGLLAISNRFSSILLVIAVLGLDSAIYRFFFDTADKNKRENVLNNWMVIQLATTIFLCVLLNVFNSYISNNLINSGNRVVDTQIIILISCFLVFSILPAILNAYFRLHRMPWHSMIFALVSSLVTIGVSVYLVIFAQKGIVGILLAQCASLLLGSAVALYMLRNVLSLKEFDKRASRSLIKYGTSILPSSLSSVGMHFLISVMLQYELSKAALGLFHTGSSFASVLTLITTSFSAAWSPFIFSMIHDEGFEKKLNQIHTLYLYTMGFISFLIFTFSKEVLQLLTAPGYYSASWVLGIQVYVTFIGSLSVFYILGMSIEKKMKFYPISTVLSSILTVICGFIMVRILDIEGVSLAMLLGQIVLVSLILYYSQKLHPIHYNFKKPAITVLAMTSVAISLRLLETDSLVFNLIYKSVSSIGVFVGLFFIANIYRNVKFLFVAKECR